VKLEAVALLERIVQVGGGDVLVRRCVCVCVCVCVLCVYMCDILDVCLYYTVCACMI